MNALKSILYVTVADSSNFKFIDLGLPSGTFWGDRVTLRRYTFPEALRLFGKKNLPTLQQATELFKYCKHEVNKIAEFKLKLTLTGPNGKKIELLFDLPFSPYEAEPADRDAMLWSGNWAIDPETHEEASKCGQGIAYGLCAVDNYEENQGDAYQASELFNVLFCKSK